MNDEEYSGEIRDASHDAMIRHLDGTPNHAIRGLISDYRRNIERIRDGEYDDLMTKPQQEGYIEGLKTVCNALEYLIEDE